MVDYHEIANLAKANGKSVADLVALTVGNDPFYAGAAGRRASADWFAEQREREGFATGTHVRRIHYRLVSREGQTDWRGKPYQNTNACWQALLCASKDARYLGTVPLEDLDDRRILSHHFSAWSFPSNRNNICFFRCPKCRRKLPNRFSNIGRSRCA